MLVIFYLLLCLLDNTIPDDIYCAFHVPKKGFIVCAAHL